MGTRLCFLPALALGAAAALLLPAAPSRAFSKIGGSLGEDQRDLRVHDDFLDATANDNATSPAQFPGWSGAELAIWKGAIEWSSRLHGDGTGDPQGGNLLGSGGANFDPLWAGAASGIGTVNHNVVSALADCGGGGTLAFTETPITDGWRIRYCDEWTWDDGPGTVGGRFDIQGIMCHEYGHALGLGHSTVNAATMFPSVSAGSTALRSIEADDALGVQCIYGIASATKPEIVATVPDGVAGTLTIHGSHFAPTDNEVWFTSASPTAASIDPIVRVTGVASSAGGTVIHVSIPPAAGPGDVVVNGPGLGHATVSNAFPTDLSNTFGVPPAPRPDIGLVSPATIEALIPGTARTITITGTDLDRAKGLLLDGLVVAASRYTILSATTITLDMPQVASLGAHVLGVTDGAVTDEFPVTIVVPSAPRLELGSGDPFNVVDRDGGLTLRFAGEVGSQHRLYGSTSDQPSSNRWVTFELGDKFTDLTLLGVFTIPAAGWLQVDVPPSALPDPGPFGTTYYAQSLVLDFPAPLPVSNLQSMSLVR